MKSKYPLIDCSSSFAALCLYVLCAFSFLLSANASADEELAVEAILQEFVKDYEQDISLSYDVTFGIKVDDKRWHVVAKARTANAPPSVILAEGFPEEPTFYYETNERFLNRVYLGEISADTGAVKANQLDYVPMDEKLMKGAKYTQQVETQRRETLFHFWTRGRPEIIKFGPQYSRNTHGAMAGVFYYGESLRTSSFILYPGMHANEDPNNQDNPFKSLMIIFKGQIKAVIGGEEVILKAGESVFIPPGVPHEFMNPFDERVEGILLMFGLSA